MNIKFYIPKGETIPSDLRLYVDDIAVIYRRISSEVFQFSVDTKDERKALEVVEAIVRQIKSEHDESQHGVSWRTRFLMIVPQDERYRTSTTIVEWGFRIRDSY